jgi:hypothetical protein
MNSIWYDSIIRWFEEYVNGYLNGDDRTRSMLELKRKHCLMVAGHCREISTELGWSDDDVVIAETLGLLHDIARFPQFSEFGTFQDAVSINHGERGCQIVSGLEFITGLSEERRFCILDGIRYHNARTIPHTLNDSSMPFVKLIRDADKLDIYRIMSETLSDESLANHLITALQVKDAGVINPDAIEDVRAGKTVDNAHITSAGDFLLMQMSWVYDINYHQTFERLFNSGIFIRIEQALPDTAEVREIVSVLLTKLHNSAEKIGLD